MIHLFWLFIGVLTASAAWASGKPPFIWDAVYSIDKYAVESEYWAYVQADKKAWFVEDDNQMRPLSVAKDWREETHEQDYRNMPIPVGSLLAAFFDRARERTVRVEARLHWPKGYIKPMLQHVDDERVIALVNRIQDSDYVTEANVETYYSRFVITTDHIGLDLILRNPHVWGIREIQSCNIHQIPSTFDGCWAKRAKPFVPECRFFVSPP